MVDHESFYWDDDFARDDKVVKRMVICWNKAGWVGLGDVVDVSNSAALRNNGKIGDNLVFAFHVFDIALFVLTLGICSLLHSSDIFFILRIHAEIAAELGNRPKEWIQVATENDMIVQMSFLQLDEAGLEVLQLL